MAPCHMGFPNMAACFFKANKRDGDSRKTSPAIDVISTKPHPCGHIYPVMVRSKSQILPTLGGRDYTRAFPGDTGPRDLF